MDLEQLKEMLAKGEITQEQFDIEVAKLEGGQKENNPLDAEAIKAIISKEVQSATDKVRTEYSGKLKAKEQELEAIKAAKMTDEELKADELKKAQEELERVQVDLKKAEQERFTTAELTKQGLSLDVAQFIQAEDNEGVTAKVEAFKKLVDKEVKIKMDAEFAKHGYTPGGSTGGAGGKNPFAAESFNLTEQGKLLKENPALAKQLAAQHGIKL